MSDDTFGLATACAFAFALLAFIAAAFITRSQAALFARYGLIDFALGLPLLFWLIWHVRGRKLLFNGILALGVLVFAAQFIVQVAHLYQHRTVIDQQRRIARYIQQNPPPQDTPIFADDVMVRVLAGLPSDRFVTSFSPDLPKDSPDQFLHGLRQYDVKYLVYAHTEASTPALLWPELRHGPREHEHFELLKAGGEPFHNVWLYQLRPTQPPGDESPD